MLNGLTECGVAKCHQYWPVAVGEELSPSTMKKVKLRVTLTSEEKEENFTIRKLLLTDLEVQLTFKLVCSCFHSPYLQSNDSREILQFHYTDWPDFGIPDSPSSFLGYVMEVRKSGSLELENYGPAIVHCSAGIGRSGTFCLVDSCLVMVRKISQNQSNSLLFQTEKGSAKINVQEVLLQMRKYRSGLIQTRDQLRFAYRAIIQGAKDILDLPNGDDDDGKEETDDRTASIKLEAPPRTKKRKGSDPPHTKVSAESASNSNNNLTSAPELRKRLREEKNKKMVETIKSMKEKQKKHESRLRTKNFLIKVGIFGLGLIATAGLVYYFWPAQLEVSNRVEESLVKLVKENVSLPDHSLMPRADGS